MLKIPLSSAELILDASSSQSPPTLPLSPGGRFHFPAPEGPLHPARSVYIAVVELHGHFLRLS